MSITFQNIHKTLKQKHKKTIVFDKASVVFPSDRINGILASPGTGKTTAAGLSTGRIYPDLGRVYRSNLVSFLVGGPGVFNGSLTGRENLAFLCRVFGFDPRPIIRFVLDFSEIGKTIDKPLKLYNRDERTRFSFSSCYAIPFEFYIADESFMGGRGFFRERCEELVRTRMQTSGFMIFSSSPRVLQKYCNSFYVIDRLGLHQVDSIETAIALLGEAHLRDGDGYTEDVADGGDSQMINPR